MPHPWAMVDSSFPTFTGGESSQEQVQKIVEYMMLLTEALKYQLENLDSNNWNDTALKKLQTDTTQDVEEQTSLLSENMILMANELTTLSNRLSAVESLTGRVNQTESDISGLEKNQETMGAEIEELTEQLGTAQGEIDSLELDTQELQKIVQTDSDGNGTLGREGKVLHLIGEIYINGKLYE